MTTFVIRNGQLIDKELAPPLVTIFGEGPYVISDEMAHTKHMVDGKYYTSKAKFREVTKANGCIEVGEETKYLTKARKPVRLDRRKRREDIKRAIHEVRNGIKRDQGA